VVCYAVAAERGDDEAYRAAYVIGLENMVAALDRPAGLPRRMIYVSSTAVYGQDGGEWVDEDSETEPSRFNGRRLLQGERLLAGCAAETIVVRLGGIYGPGRTGLVARVRSRRAVVRGDGPEYRNRIHRDDAAAALEHVAGLERPASVYLAVDHEPAPIQEVAAWLAARLGLEVPGGTRVESRGTATGKRCRNDRLVGSGFRLEYPTYREGYGALLAGLAG
jgi:nucleoside-diphosphate-sugar epimerase